MSAEYFSFRAGGWREFDFEARAETLRHAGPIDGRLSLDDRVRVLERPLPMYNNVRFMWLRSDAWRDDFHICYLAQDDALYRLNGTSPPLHELNAKASIQLTDDNVLYYLAFFCQFVHGDEGPFYVVHSLDDPMLPQGFAEARIAQTDNAPTLKHLFRAPRLFGQDKKGNWRVSALLHYSNALFLGDFLVQANGKVDMVNDEPLAGGLPFKLRFVLTAPRA